MRAGLWCGRALGAKAVPGAEIYRLFGGFSADRAVLAWMKPGAGCAVWVRPRIFEHFTRAGGSVSDFGR